MKQTLGNVHPKLAEVLADLATLKARQKKSIEAQQLLRRSIAIWRHMGAGSHPALLSALRVLTNLCSTQGKCPNPGVLFLMGGLLGWMGQAEGCYGICQVGGKSASVRPVTCYIECILHLYIEFAMRMTC